jgi:hypothetical protein
MAPAQALASLMTCCPPQSPPGRHAEKAMACVAGASAAQGTATVAQGRPSVIAAWLITPPHHVRVQVSTTARYLTKALVFQRLCSDCCYK